jgi:hypothetical protein
MEEAFEAVFAEGYPEVDEVRVAFRVMDWLTAR